MNILFLDVESTISNKGNPFDYENKLCLVGLSHCDRVDSYDIEYSGNPNRETIKRIQERLDVCDLLVGFNIKFDLHWLRKHGINFSHCLIWDCQYAEYCISGQTLSLPSLGEVAIRRMLGNKLDTVSKDYWDKGIDTRDVPFDILVAYLKQDLKLTKEIFEQQVEELQNNPQLKKLIWHGCQDILITEEMEWNGLKYDFKLSQEIGDKLVQDIGVLDSKLRDCIPSNVVDFGNHWHLSPVLYGGTLKYVVREAYSKVLKNGKTVFKEHDVEKELEFPKLVEPIKNSKLKAEGYFATDEKTLRKLKAYGLAKQIIDLVLERAKLSKKVSTYYHGFPKIYKEMNWTNDLLHGQLIHCRAATGRLSSSKPNLQNMEEAQLRCVITRFPKNA